MNLYVLGLIYGYEFHKQIDLLRFFSLLTVLNMNRDRNADEKSQIIVLPSLSGKTT